MKAIIETDKRILINQVDLSERDLINSYIKMTETKTVNVRELFDIDNNLDGASFTIGIPKKDIITYNNPEMLVILAGTTTLYDTEIDNETTMTITNNYQEYIETTISGSIVSIQAYNKSLLVNNTVRYPLEFTLVKGENTIKYMLYIQVPYLDTYTKEEIDYKIANIDKLTYQVVESIDDVTEPNIIYLVPKDDPEDNSNFWEYMLINDVPEKVGETDVDLSDYVKKEEIVYVTNEEIDELFEEPLEPEV